MIASIRRTRARAGHVVTGIVVAAAIVLAPAGVARADRVDDLVRMMQTQSSYKARMQAAFVLGKVGDPRVVMPLIGSLRDDNDAVRAAAAASLGKVGDPRARAPLEALRRDSSPIVRSEADRALAMLDAAGGARDSGGAGDTSGTRFLVSLSVAGGVPDQAKRQLSDALSQAVAHLPQVAVSSSGGGVAATSRRQTAWRLDGSITNLKLIGHRLDCDAHIAIVSLPSRAVRATATGGASVDGVSRVDDAGAMHDCLEGAAQQLTEEVGKFFRTIP